MIVTEKRSFQKLQVWQKAFNLSVNVYELSAGFSKSEDYGLRSQIRRSAVSVPSNIAEGYMRQHVSEYIQFLYIALGSASELLTQLLLVEALTLVAKGTKKVISDTNEVISILVVMVKKLKEKRGQSVIHPQPSTLNPVSPLGDAHA